MMIAKTLRRASNLVRAHFSALALAVVILCTLAVFAASPRPRSVGEALAPPTVLERKPLAAYVVLHPKDCSSNLDFLRVFGRPKFRSTISITALVNGPVTETGRANATRQLRELTGSNNNLRPLSSEAANALSALGYRATPFVVVVDSNHQVRFATSVPNTFEALQSLERLLVELARTVAESE